MKDLILLIYGKTMKIEIIFVFNFEIYRFVVQHKEKGQQLSLKFPFSSTRPKRDYILE